MVRVAAVDSSREQPALLNLAGSEPYMPVAVDLECSEVAGLVAYQRRFDAKSSIAVAFRDRLLSPGSHLSFGGRNHNGIAIQTQLFQHLCAAIQSKISNPAAVVVAVPDTWATAHWSLPVSLHRSGLATSFYTREWCAVLADQVALVGEEAILLSLGFGGARATLCGLRDGYWSSLATEALGSLSGKKLRDELVNAVSEEVIQNMRRDPREDPDASGMLEAAVEGLFRQLCCAPTATLNARLFGQDFVRQFSRQHLVALSPSYSELLSALVERLLSHAPHSPNMCPIIVWGELAVILPISEWLKKFAPSRQPVSVAPLEIVACGAAKLGALASEADLLEDQMSLPVVRSGDGAYLQMAAQHAVGQGTVRPVLERIPEGCLGEMASPRRAFLVPLDEESGDALYPDARVEIRTNHFRLGRNPASEYAFDANSDQCVSAAHAVITKDGVDFTVTDLGSLNGTFVNGDNVTKLHLLRHGDEIRLGRNGPRLRIEML